jgi:hypothetical protein
MLVAIVIIGLVVGLFYANTVYVKQRPVEKNFLVPWLGMQTFLQFGTDPYSDPAMQRVQIIYYGKLAEDNQDPLKLNKPFASELLYFPLALIQDYFTARVIWLTILELALIGLSFLCLYLFEWKLPLPLVLLYVVFSVLGSQALISLSEYSPAILVTLILITGLISLRFGLDELAGASFALIAFQPSATGIFILFTIWWLIRNHRWHVFWGGLMTLGFLFLSSFALLPGWFMPFIRSVRTEIIYVNYQSSSAMMTKLWPAIGNKVAGLLTIGIFILLIYEWRKIQTDNFRWFLWTASLSLTISSFTGLPTLVENNIILLIPFTYFIVILSERINGKNRWIQIGSILGILFISLWVGEFSLNLVNHELTPSIIKYFVPPLLLVAGLYWIRWWVIHPPRTTLEILKRDLK